MPDALASLGEDLQRIWADVGHAQQPPSQAAILATAAAAIALVLIPRAWRIARHVVTIAHEGAHGLAALLTGRRPGGIRLHRDTSGSARSTGRSTGLAMIITAAAGYLGPALLGLGAALLLGHGHALAVLWLGVFLLAVMLLQIRNLYGMLAVLVAGAGVFAVSWWASGLAQSLVAYAAAWFLLISAPRPVLELQGQRRRGGARGSDADVLSQLTPLPGLFWIGFFLAANVGALVLGARWLLS